MFVCLCNRITDTDIRRALDGGATELSQLTAELGVSGQCGSCADHAQSIIDDHLSSRYLDNGLFYAVG